MSSLKHIGCYDVHFSEPNIHNERQAELSFPLICLYGCSINKPINFYIDLQINGEEPTKFHVHLEDAGTMGYAAMNGDYAVYCVFTNVSIDWGNIKPTDNFKIIHARGRISTKENLVKLMLWA